MIAVLLALLFGGFTGTVQADDWYKTQFGTGLGNCGPACAAMAIHWATGEPVTVEQIRDQIGEPNGSRATSLVHQKDAIDAFDVTAVYTVVREALDILRIVDSGGIAILWIHTGALSKTPGDPTATRSGRYYEDECGHYIVVRGYTPDRKNLIVHDPIPGDWATNTLRYPDGGMLGRDREYPLDEVWEGLKSLKVIEIPHKTPLFLSRSER